MPRPTLDREAALQYLGAYGVFLVDCPVIALGIRGGLEKGRPNAVGSFDDLMAIVTGDVCEGFTGNTDPSTEIPGRANLVTGLHRFKQGLHHPGTPQQYPAFVQDGPILVKRWLTVDTTLAGTIDPQRGEYRGAGLWKGDFAIHIHNAMGENTTGSEGCQTIIKHEWDEYHALLAGELARHYLVSFPYLLVDAAA